MATLTFTGLAELSLGDVSLFYLEFQVTILLLVLSRAYQKAVALKKVNPNLVIIATRRLELGAKSY